MLILYQRIPHFSNMIYIQNFIRVMMRFISVEHFILIS